MECYQSVSSFFRKQSSEEHSSIKPLFIICIIICLCSCSTYPKKESIENTTEVKIDSASSDSTTTDEGEQFIYLLEGDSIARALPYESSTPMANSEKEVHNSFGSVKKYTLQQRAFSA